MKRISWRGLGVMAALVFAGVAGLSSEADAQLFPNLPIRRQRVEPVVEPPFYSHVRQNYYGYYPTCWQRFPEGWACPCPNPDAPDLAAAFKARPRDERPELPPEEGNELPEPGPGPGGAAPRPRGNTVPSLPNGTRSPFELDTPRPGAGGDLPAPTDGGRLRDLPNSPPAGTNPVAPGGATPPAGGRVDPFAPVRPSGNGPTSMKPSASLPEITVSTGPALNAPTGSGRPMLELPEMSAAPYAGAPAESTVSQPFPPSLPAGGAVVDNVPLNGPTAGSAAPAQAPRRPSMIGGLFDSLNRRRR